MNSVYFIYSAEPEETYRKIPLSQNPEIYYAAIDDQEAIIRRVSFYENRWFYSPSLSKDGTKFVLMSKDTITNISGINMLNTDGTNLRGALNVGNIRSCDWSK